MAKNQYKTQLLFPHYFRWGGLIFVLIGLTAFYLYFYGGKPDFFNSKIFAIYTSYLKTRYFVWAQTNLLDEIGAVFSLLGLLFVGFSEEKKESKVIERIRTRSLFLAIYCTIFIWILLFLVVFGWPIFIISSLVFAIFLLIFILVFQLFLYKQKRITITK